MAPESVKKLEYSRFSDIWSIGCLAIEMLTGEPPWSNYRNPMAVLFQLYNNNNPPPIPEDISEICQDFIRNCLQIDPQKRLNVYKLLRHPFITGINKTNKLINDSLKIIANFPADTLDNSTIHLIKTGNITIGSKNNNSGDSDKTKSNKNFFSNHTSKNFLRTHENENNVYIDNNAKISNINKAQAQDSHIDVRHGSTPNSGMLSNILSNNISSNNLMNKDSDINNNKIISNEFVIKKLNEINNHASQFS